MTERQLNNYDLDDCESTQTKQKTNNIGEILHFPGFHELPGVECGVKLSDL